MLQTRHTNGHEAPKKVFKFISHRRNASQNHNDITSHPLTWLGSQSQTISIGEDGRNWRPQTGLVGMYDGATALENTLLLQRVKPSVIMRPNNSAFRHIPQRNENLCPDKTCTQLFRAVLLIIPKKVDTTQIPIKHQLMNGLNRTWSIHAMEYYLGHKKR